MLVRLAFAVAVHVDPDILIVDEALAVGDVYFRQRCMRKIHEMRNRGVTIVYVTHAIADVKALGDRTLWLDHGRVEAIGATEGVVSRYLAAMSQKDRVYARSHGVDPAQTAAQIEDLEEVAADSEVSIPNIDHRFGDGRAEIIGIGLFDELGTPLQMLEPSSTIVENRRPRHQRHRDAQYRLHVARSSGRRFRRNEHISRGLSVPRMHPGEVVSVDFHVEFPLSTRPNFSFCPAIADGTLDTYASATGSITPGAPMAR